MFARDDPRAPSASHAEKGPAPPLPRLFFMVSCCIFLILNGWLPPRPACAETGILVDASGSMKGFFATSSLYQTYDQIFQAGGGQARGFYFINEGELQPYAAPDQARGVVTRIHRAYQEFRKRFPQAEAIWLITDNIQDPDGPNEEMGDIDRFYRELRRPEVERLYIFPGKLPFNGVVYGRDGHTRLGHYEGKRGLIIYAVLLNKNYLDRFEAQVAAFAAVSRLPKVLCRPLSCKIQLQVTPDRRVKRPGQGHLIFEPTSLSFTSQTQFSAGDPLLGTFLVRFRSELGNVRLRSPRVQATLLETWGDSQFHQVGAAKLEATPSRLKDLLPGEISEEVAVSVLLPKGVTYSNHPRALWNYLFSRKPSSYRARVRVALVGDPGSVGLMDDLTQQYATNDPRYFTSLSPEFQERIFGLDRLFAGGVGDFQPGREITEAEKDFEINIRVRKPLWVVFLLVGLLLALALLLVGLRRVVKAWLGSLDHLYLIPTGPDSYRLDRGGSQKEVGPEVERLPVYKLWLGGAPILTRAGTKGGRIKRSWQGFQVSAAQDFVLNGKEPRLNLPRAGGTFRLTPQATGKGKPPSMTGPPPAGRKAPHRVSPGRYRYPDD